MVAGTSQADVDLRLVRSFVAVAEEGNVTRAAARVHLAQQALSAQIIRLERRLGLRLFDRVPSGMRLTAAGSAYLVESRRTLEQARRAVEVATRAELHAARGRIAVAYKARATAHLVGRLVEAVAERDPGLEVELRSVNTLGEEVELVRDGAVEAAFVWLPTGAEGLRHEAIGSEPWLVAVAPDHRLAERDAVELSELAEDGVVGPHDAVPEVVTETWTMDPRPDGRAAPLGPIARTPEDCMQLVAAGRGVWFAPESVSGYFSLPEVRWLAVEDAEPVEVGVAFRPDQDDEVVQAVLDAAGRVFWDVKV